MKKTILILSLILFLSCQTREKQLQQIKNLPKSELNWATKLTKWYPAWDIPIYQPDSSKISKAPINIVPSPFLLAPVNKNFGKPILRKE